MTVSSIDRIASSESRRRSIAKMLLYRAMVTILLVAVTWMFTGNLGETTMVTIVFTIGATALYYVHERMWTKIKWF